MSKTLEDLPPQSRYHVHDTKEGYYAELAAHRRRLLVGKRLSGNFAADAKGTVSEVHARTWEMPPLE